MNRPSRSIRTLFVLLLIAIYPFALFLGVDHIRPSYMAAFITLAALARLFVLRNNPSNKRRYNLLPFIGLGLFVPVILLLTNDNRVLLQIPAIVNVGLLAGFLASARNPPQIIERFAREDYPVLPENAIIYCRKVFRVWCVYFAANAAVCFALAIMAPREIWLAWTSMGMYIVMGLIFAVEYLIRRTKKTEFDAMLVAMQKQ